MDYNFKSFLKIKLAFFYILSFSYSAESQEHVLLSDTVAQFEPPIVFQDTHHTITKIRSLKKQQNGYVAELLSPDKTLPQNQNVSLFMGQPEITIHECVLYTMLLIQMTQYKIYKETTLNAHEFFFQSLIASIRTWEKIIPQKNGLGFLLANVLKKVYRALSIKKLSDISLPDLLLARSWATLSENIADINNSRPLIEIISHLPSKEKPESLDAVTSYDMETIFDFAVDNLPLFKSDA
ncbi:MAG: hypothetical protein KBD31_01555 [Proteobacteria bacterium]|nr:hypothetical protein [Pseudomonadota bacterium]